MPSASISPSALGVSRNGEVGSVAGVGTPEAEQVGDNDAMPGWKEGDQVAPEVTAGRKSVEKDYGVAQPSRPGRVVIESPRTDFHELSPHQSPVSGRGVTGRNYRPILLLLQDLHAYSGGVVEKE